MFQCANILCLETEILLDKQTSCGLSSKSFNELLDSHYRSTVAVCVLVCVRSAAHVYDVSIVNAGH